MARAELQIWLSCPSIRAARGIDQAAVDRMIDILVEVRALGGCSSLDRISCTRSVVCVEPSRNLFGLLAARVTLSTL
jgi:hypothetical protein